MTSPKPDVFWSLACALLLTAGTSFSAGAQPPEGQERAWRYSSPQEPKKPDWAVELKVGEFEPDLERWAEFYGGNETDYTGLSFGYKLLRAVEIGVELGQMKDTGQGDLPISGETGGEVDFRLRTANVYVLLRGIYGEDQIAVPYIGGGVGKAYYREEIVNQPSRQGNVDSEHYRYGLQFLLDRADEPLAAESHRDFGINNTYFFIEKHNFTAEVDDIELGGDTLFMGLLFEF